MEIVTPRDYERGRKRPRRSARPCDACRRRKTRCITKDGDGSCMYCQMRHTTCTFEQSPPERPCPSKAPREDDTHSPRQPRPLPQDAPSPRSTRAVASGSSASPATANGGAETRPAMQSEAMPPRPDVQSAPPTLGFMPGRFAELYGLGSDMEPILMRHRPYSAVTHQFDLATHAIRRVLEKDDGQEYPLTFHTANDDKALNDSADAYVDSIERCVAPHGPSLVDLFWRHVQPCYPILSKDHFLHSYSRGHRHIPACLLGAVYLCALRWWSYDPELSIRQAPDAALLRRILTEALPQSYHRPRLYSIQAALLLLQCKPEDPLNPDHTYDWGITCQALAIGQCLGLHLDASRWSIPQWERNLRKRLSWALYMQDRWTALAYGRPVHIHDDDWTVQDMTSLDFGDDDATTPDDERRTIASTGRLMFIKGAELTKILSDVLSTFYTARTNREQDTVVLYERARPLLAQLDAWYADVPLSLSMGTIYQRRLCFHGSLHISYHGVLVTLLRRLIRSTALPPRCYDHGVLADIRQCALATAQNAIAFVGALRPDHLEAFWYFTSPYLFSLMGSFTTLLLVTSLSSTERTFWQETLNSYLWNLRVMSKSSEPMQYAVNRLEGAILRGLEHALAVNLHEPADDDDVSPMMANYSADLFEYTDFGDWDLPTAAGEGVFDLLSAMALEPDCLIPDHMG